MNDAERMNETVPTGDSNPGSLDCESGILPRYILLQKDHLHLLLYSLAGHDIYLIVSVDILPCGLIVSRAQFILDALILSMRYYVTRDSTGGISTADACHT